MAPLVSVLTGFACIFNLYFYVIDRFVTCGIHRDELALQASKGEGRGGRETKGEGSCEREGRKETSLSLPLSRFSFLFRS